VILSSPCLLTSTNRDRIQEIQGRFSDRFQFITCEEVWTTSSEGIKRSTNHTKGLSIDYGKYFILGGSGVDDRWLEPSEGAGRRKKQWVDYVLPSLFEDLDFVFQPTTPSAAETDSTGWNLHLELLKLALYYSKLQASSGFTRDVVSQLRLEASDGPIWSPMKFPLFDRQHDRAFSVDRFEILSIGPEHSSSSFKQAVQERIQAANSRIFIHHLYFHPSPHLLNDLADAVRRGLRLTIITNGLRGGCPFVHRMYAPRSRFTYADFLASLSPEERSQVEIWEPEGLEKISLHTKLLVADDWVIGGSSNFGYKSLESTSDHEINFATQSQEFADGITDYVQRQIPSLCSWNLRKVEVPKSYRSPLYRIMALAHRVLAPLVG